MAVKKPTPAARPAAAAVEKRPPASPAVRKAVLHGLGAIAFAGAVVGSFVACYRYVNTRVAVSDTPPAVVLVHRPAWMTDTLADEITRSLNDGRAESVFDAGQLQTRARRLAANPWVRSVREIRRVYGQRPGDTVAVDCEFRTPVAVVRWHDSYWYVDAEGVKLPEQFSGADAARLIRGDGPGPALRLIEGVANPPAVPGRVWPGDDLKAGLELLALLSDKPYADDIRKIDVGNYNARVSPNEAQLVLLTRYGTEVRWGQPVSAKAFFVEAKVDQKLAYMQNAKAQTGRVDMNLAWVDLRFDNPMIPGQSAHADGGQ